MSALTTLRLTRRAGRTLATTAFLWSCMDVETAMSPGTERDRLLHKWVIRWAHFVLRTLKVDLVTRGLHIGTGNPYPEQSPNGRGRVFVMNHRSAIDIIVTFATLEAHLVSRHDLAGWPLIGTGARRLGTLFVDRDSMGSGAAVLKLMTRLLQDGSAIAIYPEGTAFPGDEVRPFMPGAFMAARRAGAEIIPLGIAYDRDEAYFVDESFAHHMQRVASLPALRVALVAGAPIQPARGPLVKLRDEVQGVVQQLVHDARAAL